MSELQKTLGEQSGNAKSHLSSVVALSLETKMMHDLFTQELTVLMGQISVIREKVKNNPLELKRYLLDKMRPMEDELMKGEETQKNDNKASQEAMTEIKRENKETSEGIVKTFEKLKIMESKVGIYA